MALLIFRISLLATVFLSLVIPNSLQFATAASLIFCAASAFFLLKKDRGFVEVVLIYGITLLVTFGYLMVGVVRGAPSIAVFQIATVYAVSPLLWILVASAMHDRLNAESIPQWIVVLIILSSLSVALFFYLFINYGADSVTFFIETANVNLNDGYVGATMSVYGSFIFLTGALFASPTFIKNIPLRIVCLVATVAVALTSGRSALILSILVGVFIFFVFRKSFDVSRRSTGGGFALLVTFGFSALVYMHVASIDLALILTLFFEELFSGGGQERVDQGIALLNGVADTWALGAGHGIGVDYVRSEDYPWRYELVWLATLFRVGIFGFAVYFLPAIFYFIKFFGAYRRRELDKLDVFLFGGFVCAFLASNTNPYAEAFTFQWMYIVPFVYLMLKKKS